MKQIGNVGQVSDTAMTANLGDENDDGVCEHEDWEIIYPYTLSDEQRALDNLSRDDICVAIRCPACGMYGWLTAKLSEHEVEWIA